MAQFFKASSSQFQPLHQKLDIERMDHQGQGLGFFKQKPCFVRGALPGEQVKVRIHTQKKSHYEADLIQVLSPSESRVQPLCPVYQQCGGCDLQHWHLDAQRQYKQDTLQALLTQFAGQQAPEVQLLADAPWAYRRRARLAVRYDRQKKQWLLGFRARGQKKIVAIDGCPVLRSELNALLPSLQALMPKLKQPKALGHLELLAADNQTMLLLRVVGTLHQADLALWQAFGAQAQVAVVQQDDAGALTAIYGDLNACYQSFEATPLVFSPAHFIQVNDAINQAMVKQLIDWLPKAVKPRILDLFCGVGNLTLPMARFASFVVGVEGLAPMVATAQHNAKQLKLDQVSVVQADLTAIDPQADWVQPYDVVVLDPSREGAAHVVANIGWFAPQSVIYIACDPVTLARDAAVLQQQGYGLVQAVCMDMFPQTKHLESMLLFQR